MKMSVFSKLICRLNEIPIKIPASYCMDIDKMILKFVCGIAEQNAHSIKGEEQNRRLTLPD